MTLIRVKFMTSYAFPLPTACEKFLDCTLLPNRIGLGRKNYFPFNQIVKTRSTLLERKDPHKKTTRVPLMHV